MNRSKLNRQRFEPYCALFPLLRGTRGNSTAETAIMIGLILVGVISVGQFLGKRLDASNHSIAAVLGDDGLRATPAEDISGSPEFASDAESASVDLSQWMMLVQAGVCCVVLGYASYAWRARRLARRRRAKQHRLVDPGHLEQKRRRIDAILKKNRHDLANWVVRVEHVMDRKPVAITPTTRRQKVMAALEQSDHDVVLVMEKTGQLLGVITEDELESSTASTARGIMLSDVETIDASSHLSGGIALLQEKKLTWLPVLSNGVVCGVFSIDELMSTTLTLLQLITEIDAEHRAILHRALDSGPATAQS